MALTAVNPSSSASSPSGDVGELFHLPSYSPQLNPEERFKANLKQDMGKRVPLCAKAQLRPAANEAMLMLERTPERAISYFHDRRVRYAAA